MYVKVTNGVAEKYSIGQLRRDNPNISFPKNPSDELLAGFNVFPCSVTDVGVYDALAWGVISSGFEQTNGAWVEHKALEALPLDIAQKNIRDRRNELLTECDWTQLADATVNSLAWANYRQSLRDIPSQEGFPYNVIWPTKP